MERLDVFLVNNGYFQSREKAKKKKGGNLCWKTL